MEIVIYQDGAREFTLPFDKERETIWATQAQIVELFGVDVSGVSRHIRNLFDDREVDEASNLQKLQTIAPGRPAMLYSLDVILAVGYRANSARAIAFRRWATGVLRAYMLEGAAINRRRLEEIGSIVRVLSRSTSDVIAGVADVLAEYLPSLRTLRDFDAGAIESAAGEAPAWELTIDGARQVIDEMRSEFPADTLLGVERGEGLQGVIGAIYQGFGGQDVYPTLQEKAANLLYLIVKDHPLSDGNKRTAAALFVHFLAYNHALADERGELLVSNNALAAITLLVAMSDPREKDLMISLILRMLNGEVG
jgi:prophage maintenance system killer protein